MKEKIAIFFVLIFLVSCTSNTILEKPKDLIPRDTMSLLLQEMMIATSAKFIKNKNQQKNINYMPFVYEKYNIDSIRFETSNYYYMSTIDIYKEILESAREDLNKKHQYFKKIKTTLDSIKKDSLKKVKIEIKRLDSLKIVSEKRKDSLKLLKFKN